MSPSWKGCLHFKAHLLVQAVLYKCEALSAMLNRVDFKMTG